MKITFSADKMYYYTNAISILIDYKSTLLIPNVTVLTRHIYRHWYLSCRYDAFLQILQSCLH